MDTFSLPVVKDPPIRTYLHYAFPFSLLMLNEYYNDWILNNFIQVVYSPKNSCPFDYHEYFYDHWPCLEVCRMEPDMVGELPDTLSYIQRMMEKGWYCFAWVDCYYIPGSPLYKTRRDTEGLLLYGYDTIGEPHFQALTYTDGLKYKEIPVPFTDFYRSLESDKFGQLQFVRVNSRCSVDYRILRIQKKLQAYLHSENMDFDDIKYHRQDEIEAYGVQACREAIRYLRERKPDDVLDLRIPYLFAEHKRTMMFRIDKIMESYALPYYPFSSEDRKKLTESADKVLYYCMKCKIQGENDPHTLSHACSLAEQVLDKEKEMLTPIIEFPWEGFLAYRKARKKQKAALLAESFQ